jgi:hypothetical protein
MRRRQVTAGGFSSKRLVRVRELLERHVDSGFVPGVVAVLARHGEVHIEATGNLAFEGEGSRTPMAGDTICRLGSMAVSGFWPGYFDANQASVPATPIGRCRSQSPS